MSSTGPPNTVDSEIPANFHFQLAWASPEERETILGRMRVLGRQTMNLRVMPHARLMRLTRDDGLIVGWGVVDFESNPGYPELSSLNIESEYRTYTLGLVVELARYTFLKNRGFRFAYARMDANANYSLLRYRVANKLYEALDKDKLDPAYVEHCKRCELHGVTCLEQQYFTIDLDRFITTGEARIGPIDVEALPLTFDLRKDRLRQMPRGLHPEPDGQPPREYRPYWL